MIETKEKLFASSKAGSIISRELAEELYKMTKNPTLKEAMEKDPIVIKANTREDIKTEYENQVNRMANARANRKGVGGRKRLPDPANPDELQGEEKRRYLNRLWQRQSRARRQLESNG